MVTLTKVNHGSSVLNWRKSRYSDAQGACLEAASSEKSILIRDSRSPNGSILEVSVFQWRKLIDELKSGKRI